MSRELLARVWKAGAGPGDAPFTIDLDSTICETYGLAKEGARHHGYTGARGYHPLLAIAAGTGDVLMARLREGRANTARGAAHFLRETVSRVRYGGASGQLTVRADSGFYTHAVVALCRKMKVRFSITIRQHAGLRNLIEAIPEADWTPIPYWMDGAADVAETTYTPFRSEPDATPVRLIVRRVKPTPGSQLALFATYSYHGFITDRYGETLELEADHRRHAEIENAIRDLNPNPPMETEGRREDSGRAPSGWEWNGSQSGQGATGLFLPRPALGKMPGEAARGAGEPSGQGEEPPLEGLGGHDLLAQADAGGPTGQVMRHHLYCEPGGVGGEAPRGHVIQPDAVLPSPSVDSG